MSVPTEAEANIQKAIRIEGNGFNAIVHIDLSPTDLTFRARCVFDLNGKRMIADATAPPDCDPEEIISELKKAVAAKLTTEILSAAFDHADRATLNILLRR